MLNQREQTDADESAGQADPPLTLVLVAFDLRHT